MGLCFFGSMVPLGLPSQSTSTDGPALQGILPWAASIGHPARLSLGLRFTRHFESPRNRRHPPRRLRPAPWRQRGGFGEVVSDFRGIWQPSEGFRPRRFSGMKIAGRQGRKPFRASREEAGSRSREARSASQESPETQIHGPKAGSSAPGIHVILGHNKQNQRHMNDTGESGKHR